MVGLGWMRNNTGRNELQQLYHSSYTYLVFKVGRESFSPMLNWGRATFQPCSSMAAASRRAGARSAIFLRVAASSSALLAGSCCSAACPNTLSNPPNCIVLRPHMNSTDRAT